MEKRREIDLHERDAGGKVQGNKTQYSRKEPQEKTDLRYRNFGLLFQWRNEHFKPRMLLFSVGNGAI